ncbi:MAG: LysR family transcriptional regulator [Hydrogenophaga sp.]|jgi:DNA-binding transcriptional LysR family regulator|uniref:LysR family transcriptional regulator n=1 Tax=Hydrogenophaga sp. TaxID=1904254 RepID=UPI001DD2AAED|nr:LysR family transcriptional regulator [Hydrogenophaga sp.]MBW0169477.1 LysR family transcriptional regulator [Hydrogenophaga sp.]MBW0182925.1 LysR family transcriptional regulator [Hydrogenophaga sp.]
MNPNDFRLFLEVAELGSFTKAAVLRQTVQSHISRQIGELEKQCGGALFRRTGRGVVLTDLGHRVEARVRGWVRDTDQLLADIRVDAGEPMGEVRLGILPSAAHPLMTHVFLRLKTEFPKIKLNVREGQGGELDALLDMGSVDMAILFRYQKPTGADEKLLAVAGTYLVSRPGDALTQGETFDFTRLAGLRLVLPRRPAHWRAVLDETARSKGFVLQAEVEADSLRVQKELVAHTPGLYSLLGPFSIDAELRAGRLQASRVVNPDLRRHVTLALPKQGQLTPASKIVARMLRETVEGWGHRLSEPEDAPADPLPG